MKTVGFPISHKENELRRAIVPEHIAKMEYADHLYFERGYGAALGVDDADYAALGCHLCSHEEALRREIVCDPKVGDADYLETLSKGQTVFGWIHATQNRDITDKLIGSGLTCYAWEKMYDDGRHIFRRTMNWRERPRCFTRSSVTEGCLTKQRSP